MLRSILFLLLVSTTLKLGLAQIQEDFEDGDFSTNPSWTGTTADFLVNATNQLQLNNTIASTSYLSTAHGLTNLDNKEWRFWVKQSFSPSSSNFGQIYLTADNADLTLAQNGFYLQFGEAGSLDAIRLYKLENGTSTELCSGTDAEIATSFEVSVKVVRDASGNWSVFTDFTGAENYALHSTANDATALLGVHFGMLSTYTVSNATKFYYDNIYVGDEVLDLEAPILNSASALSTSAVEVLFNEALDQAMAENTSNYTIAGVSITSATLDALDQNLVHLSVATLQNNTTYTLQTNNIADLSGNVSGAQSTDFTFLISDSALVGDVIINELFADPSPVIGLPEYEYVELYNRSTKTFNLANWKLGDASSQTTLNEYWLLPNQYVVLTSTAGAEFFGANTLAVSSFPSLNNASDEVVLKSTNDIQLDKVSYTDDWYRDEVKKSGGYSLERINPNDPCSDGDNWIASNWILGGTPGTLNSVLDTMPDTNPPYISMSLGLAPNFLEVRFSEGMDSSALMNAVFASEPVLTPTIRYVMNAAPNQMTFEFAENLIPSQLYAYTLETISDCWQNNAVGVGEFILPDMPGAGDVVINEILSNPLTGGHDFVELYNNSQKAFDLIDWQMANYDNDTIDNLKSINEHYVLMPNEYVVLTKDSNFIKANYPFYAGGKFLYCELPSYNNDSGSVYLVYENTLLDGVSYTSDWQFELLDDDDGVSLERIDPDGLSNSVYNWHSAAEDRGFATPGLKNSQYTPVTMNGHLELSSEILSPDNDGYEDFLQFTYEMQQAGLLGRATIFDERGRKISQLFSNELLGSNGVFTWDGVTEDGGKASIGVYLLIFEAFSTDGSVFFVDKKAFSVAGKF